MISPPGAKGLVAEKKMKHSILGESIQSLFIHWAFECLLCTNEKDGEQIGSYSPIFIEPP